jgi:hypothetical protein
MKYLNIGLTCVLPAFASGEKNGLFLSPISSSDWNLYDYEDLDFAALSFCQQ